MVSIFKLANSRAVGITRSNSVLSGGVGLHGSYSSIQLPRSELRIRKGTELSSENVLRSIACLPTMRTPHVH